jgi:TolB-like protein
MSKPMKRNLLSLFIVSLVGLGMMQGCVEKKAPSSQGLPLVKRIAVWDMEDLSVDQQPYEDFGRLFSDEILKVLSSHHDVEIVDREQLVRVLEELNLGSSELADQTTRLRLGRLAGANLMIFGAYQYMAGQWRIDLRLVDVETGRVVRTASRSFTNGDLDYILQQIHAASEELLSPLTR